MRQHLWSLVSGFLLAAIIVSVPARADVTWTGSGWYAEAIDPNFDIILLSGPYSSKADCEPALNQYPQNGDYLFSCTYETSDPTKGGG